MKFSARIPLAVALALSCAGDAWADGEVVVTSQRSGDWRITLLASPWPLRVGAAEFSVLVQDVRSGSPLEDAKVELEIEALAPLRRDVSPRRLTPVRAAGANPWFQTARTELPRPGRWQLRARVTEPPLPALAGVGIQVAPAASLFARHGFALALPFVGVALFWLHQWLRAQRPAGRPSHNLPGSQ